MDWDLEKLTTVATFGAAWEARLALARLAAEGIEASIADENVSHLYGGGVVGGIKLQVREDDAARAGEILAQESPLSELYLVTEEDAQEPRCPQCRTTHVDYESWPRSRWTCGLCGATWRDEEPVEEEAADLVTVARFRTPWEAHLARTLLESHGLDACVLEDRFPPVDLLTGQPLALNRLAVHPEDAAQAAELLAAAEEGAAGSAGEG